MVHTSLFLGMLWCFTRWFQHDFGIFKTSWCPKFGTNPPQGFCRFAETCLDHGVYDGLLGRNQAVRYFKDPNDATRSTWRSRFEAEEVFQAVGLKIQGSRSGWTQDESCFPGQNHKGIIFFWILCRVPSSGVKIQKVWCRMTNSGWLLERTSFSEKWTCNNHAWLIFFQDKGRNLCLSNWLSKQILKNFFHRYSGALNWVATG